jgi:hypothetical protein
VTVAEYDALGVEIEQKLVLIAQLRAKLKVQRQQEAANATPVAATTPTTPYTQADIGAGPGGLDTEPQSRTHPVAPNVGYLPPSEEEQAAALEPSKVEGSAANQAFAVLQNAGKDAVGLVLTVPEMAKQVVSGTGDEKVKLAQELIAFAPVHAYHLLNAAGLIPAPLAETLRNVTTEKPVEEAGLTPQQLYDKHKLESQQYVGEHPLATVLGAGGVARLASGTAAEMAKPEAARPETSLDSRLRGNDNLPATDIYKTEPPATPKEQLAAVTPLEELQKVKAGEPAAVKPETNVLIDAEEAARSEEPTRHSALGGVQTPEPTAAAEVKAGDRGKQVEELVDIDRRMEEKRASGEDLTPEIEAIEKMRESEKPGRTKSLGSDYVFHNTHSKDIKSIMEEGLTQGSFSEKPIDYGGDTWIAVKKSDLPNAQVHDVDGVKWYEPANLEANPVTGDKIIIVDKKGRPTGKGAVSLDSRLRGNDKTTEPVAEAGTKSTKPTASGGAPSKSDVITEVAEKAKIGDKIYYQLAKHRKPHKGTVSDIVTMPDGRVRVFLGNGDVTTPDRIKLPTKTVRLREYHAAFADVPKEGRGQVKLDAKRFDELLQEHYRIIDPQNESAQVWQSTLEETGKDFAAHSASLDRLRNLAGEKFGIDDLYNPVTRAKALPQLEKLIAEAPKEEAKGITAPKGGETTFESSSGKAVQMADVDVKPGDKLFMDAEWYDVEPSETPGNIKLKDGRTLDVDDTFDRSPVEKVVRPEPKTEMTPAGEQYLMPGTEGRQVPEGTIKSAGKKVNAPIEQGDLMQPGKIAKGNLPQDQVDAFAAEKPRRGTVTERLTELADIERSRMAKRHGKGGGPTTARTGLDPQIAIDIAKDLKSLSVIGAEKIVNGATKFKDWSRQMLDEYEGKWREMWGQDIRDHLEAIWERSKEQFHQLRGRYMAREHADFYKNELSQPQEYRPNARSRISEIAETIKERIKAEKPTTGTKGKAAQEAIFDKAWDDWVNQAWDDMRGELWEAGVPFIKATDGELIPIADLGKPKGEVAGARPPEGHLWDEIWNRAREKYQEEHLLKNPETKRAVMTEARAQYMAEIETRGIATKVRGQAGSNVSRIMQSRRWALDVLERGNLKGVDAEELANMRRLFRTHPDLVVDKLDALLKKHGIIIPFIRKSGTYVPADAMLHKYKEPAWGGEIQDTQRLIEEIDNVGSAEAKSVLRDQMGPAVRRVLVPFHKIFRQRSFWLADQEAVVKQLGKGLTEPQQEFTTKLLLKLERGDGTAPTEELLNRSDIWDMFRKDYQPIVDKVEQLRAKISDRPLPEQASQIEALVTDEALKSGLLKKAQKAQNWHDDLFEQQNEMHRLRHEPEMPYRKFYGGAQILKKDVAAKLRKVADEHRELTETDIKDLGLGGEYLEQLREIDHEARAYRQFGRPSNFNNPRELQREIPRDPAIHEMKLPVLMRHYANQAARTIFTQSIVENNRVFADMLEQTGYPKASVAIHNWTSEAFAGQNNPIDAWFEKIGMSGYLNIAGKAKQGLIRSSFPLNIPWIVTMQSTNLESILAHEGPLNLGKAIKDIGNAKIRAEIKDRAHAYIAKSLQQGKVSSESFDQGMSGALRNADERWMGIKGTEKFSAKLDNAMEAENYFSEKLEEWMTLVAVRAGYLDGLKKGLKPGSDALWEHASAAGGRAATLFNTEDLPAILRSKAVRSHFPFQTFSFSMYNSMREIAGRTGTPPATATERMKIVIGFLAAATVTNYATNKLAGRKPWDLSSGLPFYGSIFAPVLAPLTGDDAGTRGLPSPLGTTIEFGKALESAIAKGDFEKLTSWAMKYGSGMAGFSGGTEADRLRKGILAAAKEGVYDAKGKKMFPINGLWPKFQSVFGGPYSTEAGQEFIEGNNKAAVNLKGATTRLGKEGQRLLKAIPGVGDFVTSGGREKAPAAKRTELRKAIFEGVKNRQEGIPDDARRDLEGDVEKFMWEGGDWPDLKKSLEDRYATPEEIKVVRAAWDSRVKALDAAGVWDDIRTKRFQIKKQEKAEAAAEKKKLEEERDARRGKPLRAFQVKKAG